MSRLLLVAARKNNASAALGCREILWDDDKTKDTSGFDEPTVLREDGPITPDILSRCDEIFLALPHTHMATSGDEAQQGQGKDKKKVIKPASINFEKAQEWIAAKVGRGLETVLDPTVRRSAVLPGATVKWDGLADALESTRKQLCPWFPPNSLRADLHSVLCYSEGDFFELHRDAPKGSTHIITLTVDCSPPVATTAGKNNNNNNSNAPQPSSSSEQQHVGGDVIIADDDIVEPLMPEPKNKEKKKNKYAVEDEPIPRHARKIRWRSAGSGSWASWFNNTYHCVTPVTSGKRFSATYNVSVAPEHKNTFALPPDSKEAVALVAAAADLKDLDLVEFEPYALGREYVFDPETPSPDRPEGWFHLQGRDRLFVEAMRMAYCSSSSDENNQLSVQVRGFVISFSERSDDTSIELVKYDEEDNTGSGKNKLTPMRPEDKGLFPQRGFYGDRIGSAGQLLNNELIWHLTSHHFFKVHQNTVGNEGGGHTQFYRRAVVFLAKNQSGQRRER